MDEMVELIVRGAERPGVARALLDAADRLGLPARVVASTSTGYIAPRAVAVASGLALAESVDPPPGPEVLAAAGPEPQPVPGEGGGTQDDPLPGKKPQKASQPRGKRKQ